MKNFSDKMGGIGIWSIGSGHASASAWPVSILLNAILIFHLYTNTYDNIRVYAFCALAALICCDAAR